MNAINNIPVQDMLEVSRLASESAGKIYETVKDTAVSGYKAIESAVVGAYAKIEDGFVDTFLRHEGETVQEAKARLKAASRAEEESNERN